MDGVLRLLEGPGVSWVPLGPSWGGLGGSWSPLGRLLEGPGVSWAPLGPSWGGLGGSWRPLGRLLGGLGDDQNITKITCEKKSTSRPPNAESHAHLGLHFGAQNRPKWLLGRPSAVCVCMGVCARRPANIEKNRCQKMIKILIAKKAFLVIHLGRPGGLRWALGGKTRGVKNAQD